jgi:molecular chaperone GrpE
MPASEETGSGPVIHDHRRIDPVTGQVRGRHAASKPAGTAGAGRQAGASGSAGTPGTPGTRGGEPAGGQEEAAAADATDGVLEGILEDPEPAAGQKQTGAEAQLAERTADLQRLQAEYANYRKRVDRDRAAVKEQAVAGTLAGLLPVLDAIDQAREHGELSGGFKSVADSLQAALGRLGLITYGEKGDPFDPKIHEALTHSYSSDVTEDTCVEILQPGYKVGDRILRPARVAVAAPATGPDGSSNEAARSSDEEGN